ncbi:MAG: DUF4870 domain-containing protein [Chloroflexi bacterium]|nr:DUF4870 domain-containing protein [Chloroflexota bacterium]
MMESENTTSEVTQDERILAALAHASVILPLWGLIAAIVIWATQREKTRFVGFQALQGVAYQLCIIMLAFLGGACYMCSFLGMFAAMPLGIFAMEGVGNPDALGGLVAILITFLTSFFPFCVMGVFLLIGATFVLYGLYGAVQVLQGHDFRYAIIGQRLEDYLSQEQIVE